MSKENPFVLDEIVLEMREYIANAKNLLNAIEEGLNCENTNVKKLSIHIASKFVVCMDKIHEQKETIELNTHKLVEKLHQNKMAN